MKIEHKSVKRVLICALMALVCLSFSFVAIDAPAYAATKTYTISTSSKPCDSSFLRYSTYNKYTKQYYLLRSYMEKFEKAGGGTLILKAGTYNMPVTVYVPSNVTIKFQDGVVLNKTKTTGTNQFSYSKSMFMLCAPSKAKKANRYKAGKYKYGYKKYSGVHDVSFIGEGTVKLNLNYLKFGIGIDMAHTNNTTFSGITFKNAHDCHFMEVDASKNVNISNCKFNNVKNESKYYMKEAINLDTPDLKTQGFSAPWSSFDKTANDTVTISNCTFTNMYRAIGTHNYSPNHPHTNITITGCTIDNMKSDAISAMYWKDVKITNNNINTVAHDKNNSGYRAILGPGTDNITITGNTFTNMNRVAQFYPWRDLDNPSYKIIYPNITEQNKADIKNNTYNNISENYIRVITDWDSEAKAPDWYNWEEVPFQ